MSRVNETSCYKRYILEQCYAGILSASEVLRIISELPPPEGMRAIPNYERGVTGP